MRKSFILFTTITIALFVFTPKQLFANSELETELAKCVSVSGDLERLDCFESTLRKRGLLPSVSEKKSPQTKWISNVKVNPLDDSKTVVLALMADSGKGRYGGDVHLILRCMSNKTEAYINWADYLGSDSAQVLIRVGNEPAVTKTWSLSTDNQSTFITGSIQFIQNLMTATSFVAQVTPYNESPVTAIFDTTGLDQEIKELRETCGW